MSALLRVPSVRGESAFHNGIVRKNQEEKKGASECVAGEGKV